MEDIVRLLLHSSLKSSKFTCSKAPSSVFKGASFVVDLDSLQNIDEISADDMGVWKNNRVDTSFVKVTMGRSSVRAVVKCSSKDQVGHLLSEASV